MLPPEPIAGSCETPVTQQAGVEKPRQQQVNGIACRMGNTANRGGSDQVAPVRAAVRPRQAGSQGHPINCQQGEEQDNRQ